MRVMWGGNSKMCIRYGKNRLFAYSPSAFKSSLPKFVPKVSSFRRITVR
jgi:hypothetical protein